MVRRRTGSQAGRRTGGATLWCLRCGFDSCSTPWSQLSPPGFSQPGVWKVGGPGVQTFKPETAESHVLENRGLLELCPCTAWVGKLHPSERHLSIPLLCRVASSGFESSRSQGVQLSNPSFGCESHGFKLVSCFPVVDSEEFQGALAAWSVPMLKHRQFRAAAGISVPPR